MSDQWDDWGPWTAARFESEKTRDAFLRAIADSEQNGWAAKAMDEDGRAAWVQWRLGHFLGLNDLAYAHGGRIVVSVVRHWIV